MLKYRFVSLIYMVCIAEFSPNFPLDGLISFCCQKVETLFVVAQWVTTTWIRVVSYLCEKNYCQYLRFVATFLFDDILVLHFT